MSQKREMENKTFEVTFRIEVLIPAQQKFGAAATAACGNALTEGGALDTALSGDYSWF
jgi:hypothetical protein